MAALPRRRHGCGSWIAQVDWHDLADRAIRYLIVLGWLGFVAAMLALALERAP